MTSGNTNFAEKRTGPISEDKSAAGDIRKRVGEVFISTEYI